MILFNILFVITAAIYGLILELSLNTVFGWGAFIAVMTVFYILNKKTLLKKSGLKKIFSWIVLFILLVLIYIISYPPYRRTPAVNVKDPVPTGVVTVAQGKLTGVYNTDKTVEVYTGIPYAKPPVGELRWKEPKEPEPWEGIRVCDHFAPRFMQREYSTLWDSLVMLLIYNEFDWFDPGNDHREPMSEDALYLNVWKPEGDVSNCPVIFFIHGGSNKTGTSSYDQYNGEAFAKRGIVFVDFGYRLNIFGFYSDEALAEESLNGTTGNYGVLDQIAALKWVRNNIAAFGGDPDNITIAGESSGSSCVNAICVSPLAKGCFRRAIAESSGIATDRPFHSFRPYKDALAISSSVYEAMRAATIDELRAVDAHRLVTMADSYDSLTVDGYVIPEQPAEIYRRGENNEEALLNGYNSSEADVFTLLGTVVTKENYAGLLRANFGETADDLLALYPAGDDPKEQYNKIMGGAWFAYSHYRWSRYMTEQGRPVYEYFFTKTNKGLSDNHAGELPYFYGNLDTQKQNYDETDQELSDMAMDYIENFVRTGNPNGEGLPMWQDCSEDETLVFEFGTHCGMTEDVYQELYKVLEKSGR